MLIRYSASSVALETANMHADVLPGVSVDGALLVLDVDMDAGVNANLIQLSQLDRTVLGMIADSDDESAIRSLTELRSALVAFERPLLREHLLISRARVASDAIAPIAESQLHGEQHADSDDSSQSSNGADAKEEIENGSQDQQNDVGAVDGNEHPGSDRGGRRGRRGRTGG